MVLTVAQAIWTEEMLPLLEEAMAEGSKWMAGNKSAGRRCRKAIDHITKLKVEFRRATLAEEKRQKDTL